MSDTNPYIVSARKYRPSSFKTVVGQKALTNTLKNAIDSHRLAQAYLFCGPRGVGKTSCARIFAKTINCLSPTPDGDACGQCESCRAIEKGNSFNLMELDAASNNSVDDIRSITEQVNVPPQNGKYRIFIIDEVHMLSNQAFNAFLKTLEEPPKNVIFILATTEKHKVIPTILSRCQIYDFKRMGINDIIEHLEFVAKEEGIATDREALGVIALKADGAMRDALSIFDQVAASTRGNVTYENTIANLNVLDYDIYFKLTAAFGASDVPAALLIYKEIRDKGFDSLFFINGLAEHIRNLMVAADQRTITLLELSQEMGRKYGDQARSLPLEWYYEAIRILNDCDYKYRTSSSKRLSVELALIRLCQILKPSATPFAQGDRLKPLDDLKPARDAAPSSPHSENAISHSDAPASPSPASPQYQAQGAVNAAPPGPQHQRNAGARPRSFRLSDASAAKPAAGNSLERKNTPFSPQDFMRAWNGFMNENPSLHILVNAMRSAQPQQASDVKYNIQVDHPAQKQAFELAMTKLLQFMREKLANDFVEIAVTLSEAAAAQRPPTPREFLQELVSSNPTMAKFLNDIDAELM